MRLRHKAHSLSAGKRNKIVERKVRGTNKQLGRRNESEISKMRNECEFKRERDTQRCNKRGKQIRVENYKAIEREHTYESAHNIRRRVLSCQSEYTQYAQHLKNI